MLHFNVFKQSKKISEYPKKYDHVNFSKFQRGTELN